MIANVLPRARRSSRLFSAANRKPEPSARFIRPPPPDVGLHDSELLIAHVVWSPSEFIFGHVASQHCCDRSGGHGAALVLARKRNGGRRNRLFPRLHVMLLFAHRDRRGWADNRPHAVPSKGEYGMICPFRRTQ